MVSTALFLANGDIFYSCFILSFFWFFFFCWLQFYRFCLTFFFFSSKVGAVVVSMPLLNSNGTQALLYQQLFTILSNTLTSINPFRSLLRHDIIIMF
jgi:hypothetical protein